MKKLLQLAGIFSVLMCTILVTNAVAQKNAAKKGQNVDWVKLNELITYNPAFMQELCCDCSPKTIADLLVGTTAIDGLIQNACQIATRDMEITRKIEFVKINVSDPDAEGIRNVNITDGSGNKITALSASKQLLELSKEAIQIASEAQALIDKKDAAQKEIEDASFFKKASLTRGMGRGVDILQTIIKETSKQTEKIKKQVDALTMLKEF